jgi:drug/metabolite transporter (DMT)-like permease
MERLRRLRSWTYSSAYLLLTATMAMWGANAVAGKLAVGAVSPMALTALRWILACCVLSIVGGRQLKADWPVLRKHVAMIGAMGALGFTGFNALFYEAAHYTSAVNITILQGAIPVFVFIGALLVHRVPASRGQVFGMAVTLLGVLVLASQGHLETLAAIRFNTGDLWMLVACGLYAGYTVALRNRPRVSAMGFFTAIAIAACITSLPLVAVEALRGNLLWPTPAGWLIVAFVGLFPSLIAQIFFMRGVELIGPGRASLFVNLVPVIGSLLAVLILGESFGLHHAVALSLVLGGILIAEHAKPS